MMALCRFNVEALMKLYTVLKDDLSTDLASDMVSMPSVRAGVW